MNKKKGRGRLRSVEVILPRPEYFPDPYNGSPEDARVMLDRVCGYMGINPQTIELDFYQDRNPLHDERGKVGTAGLYDEAQGKYRVWVEVSQLDDPLATVATMAHELGHVHLLGSGRISPEDGRVAADKDGSSRHCYHHSLLTNPAAGQTMNDS